MDYVKMTLILAMLVLEACSRKSEQPVQDTVNCAPYASAYEVEFPDNSIRKASVEACDGSLKATDLSQGSLTIEARSLTIRLYDAKTGLPYMTLFDGQ